MAQRHGSWRTTLLVLAILACGASRALAQEHDCSSEVQQVRSELEARLAEESRNEAACQESQKRLLSAVERSQADIAELKRADHAKENQIAELTKQLESEKSANAAHLSTAEQLRTSFAARLADAQSGHETAAQKVKAEYDAIVAELKSQLAAKGNFDGKELLAALVATVKKYVACSVNELKEVAQGLKQGNTAPLNTLFHKITASVSGHARAGYAWAVKALDEHLPFVKHHATELYGKANELYQKHIGDTAWGAEVQKQLATANKDIKAFLKAQVKKHPALKSLDDPVYLQLATYIIFAAPLLLLFLPVLLLVATVVAPASKSSASTASKSSKKKKGKAPANKPKGA